MTVYTLFLYIGLAALVLLLTLGVGHSKLRKHTVMRPVVWYLQYFVGALLLFSGFIKAVDPLGTAYKMQDYFEEFQRQGFPLSEFMHSQALPFSVFMLVVELVLGFCLILGIGGRRTTFFTLLMMLFFTWLTGFNYLTGFTPNDPDNDVGFFQFSKWAAFNENYIRIKDCGCFGDFMKLTPLQTFLKDVFLVIVTIGLHIKGNQIKDMLVITANPEKKQISSKKIRIGVVAGLSLLSWLFCLNNYYFNDAFIDFRPFYVGVDMVEAKKTCKGAEKEIKFIYLNEQTNEEKLLTMAEMTDTTNKYLFAAPWKYKDRTEVIIKEACTSKIREFGMEGDSSETQTKMMEIVYDTERAHLVAVAANLDNSSKSAFKEIAALAAAAEKDGIPTTAFYSHIEGSTVEEFRHTLQLPFPVIWADDKLLKTIIRANPGLLLIKNGKIIQKWHHWHIPNYDGVKSALGK